MKNISKIIRPNSDLTGSVSGVPYPISFIEQMKTILGNEYFDFESSLSAEMPVSIRLNSGIKSPDKTLFPIPDFRAKVSWCDSGIYLTRRPSFTLDPLFHSGAYYVQEAASMFVEQCVDTVKQYATIDRVLDLCAAPGGKSTHLLSLFPDSLVVCNEAIRSRVTVLEENIAKWGHANAVVVSCDPATFDRLNHFFDFILVDAPCSGEGMFRKESEALKNWSPDTVKHCAARQMRIVRDVWNALKPGGFMLYCTCTYNTEENEQVVRYIIEQLGAESVPVDCSAFQDIASSVNSDIHACRFFPHRTASEGLFLSLIRKDGELKSDTTKRTKPHFTIPAIDSWVRRIDDFTVVRRNDRIYIIARRFAADVEQIGRTIYTLSSGVEVCTVIGNELIPSFDFAHSVDINIDNFAVVDVDRATALSYLKKETLSVPSFVGRGYILLTYMNVPLGWVKNIGSRCNNILPRNRRIRITINGQSDE
jgi:16S rRNA C967 or C1407 C5-methylase (RsmB/RsmF family)